jgi:hypothetical protein
MALGAVVDPELRGQGPGHTLVVSREEEDAPQSQRPQPAQGPIPFRR